jgi:N utilization substance protein A
VKDVYVLDEAKHLALAVVADSQLSVAIGKQGLNVRLANRLCDWSIDVKTEEQFLQMDRGADLKRAVNELFGEAEEPTVLNDLPGMEPDWVNALEAAGIATVEDFLSQSKEAIAAVEGLSAEAAEKIQAIVDENVEVVEDVAEVGNGTADVSEIVPDSGDVYECPDCGSRVTPEMTHCPNCGVELSFEYEDDGEA